jgi:hypothetical protein
MLAKHECQQQPQEVTNSWTLGMIQTCCNGGLDLTRRQGGRSSGLQPHPGPDPPWTLQDVRLGDKCGAVWDNNSVGGGTLQPINLSKVEVKPPADAAPAYRFWQCKVTQLRGWLEGGGVVLPLRFGLDVHQILRWVGLGGLSWREEDGSCCSGRRRESMHVSQVANFVEGAATAYGQPLFGWVRGRASRTSSVRGRVEKVEMGTSEGLVLMEVFVAGADAAHRPPLRAWSRGGGASRTPSVWGRVEGTWMGNPVVLVSIKVSLHGIVQDNHFFCCIEDSRPTLERGCSQRHGGIFAFGRANNGHGWDVVWDVVWVLCRLTFAGGTRAQSGQVDGDVSAPHFRQACGDWELGGPRGLEVYLWQQQPVGRPKRPSLAVVGYCGSKAES